MKKIKILLLMGFIGFIILFNYFDLAQFLSLTTFKQYQFTLASFYHHSPIKFIVLFGFANMVLYAASCPGAVIFTFAGGAIFGPTLASLIIIIGGSIGATIAMLSSRYIFRDFIELKFDKWVKSFDSLLCNNPFFTICAIRFIPIFPFFAVNLLAGVTHVYSLHFLFGTLLGMLPSTYLYATAGLHLSEVTTINEIITLKMGILFSCLGFLAIASLILKKRLL
jgi:uncharacterized membrane protein YdjX (TVP38/TMEM64 family)